MEERGEIHPLPPHWPPPPPTSRPGSAKNPRSIASSSSTPIPLDRREYTREEADAVPWKFIGYRVFSRWLATNQSFLIVRRFGAANTRVLLWLQDQVADLEEQLAEIDDYCARRGTGDFDNGTFRNDPREDRRRVMEQLQVKLIEYNNFVSSYSPILNRSPVRPLDIQSVRNWLFSNHPSAISTTESAFINYTDDLMAVQPQSKSPVRLFLERSNYFRTRFFKHTPSDPLVLEPENYWNNDQRMEQFAGALIGGIGLAMLIAPLWILNFVPDIVQKLGVITAFIMVFFALAALATTAKTFETLAAAAAYSAVLMVFLQLGGH